MDYDRDRTFGDVAGKSGALSQSFMSRVYMWMTFGLAATGAVAYYASTSPAVIQAIFGRSVIPWVVIMLAELGLVFFLSSRVMTLNPSTASALFFVYSALNGITLSPIFLIYELGSISSTFFITAGVFGGMSMYGTVTKRDLTGWGSFLSMGLWGILIALAVNMFVRSERMSLVTSVIAVIVFTGLAAYDTHKLRRIASQGGFGDDARDNLAVLGALTLYLDFVNLFLHLIRIMGKRK
ncbi:MAG: Bax inhibitor-1/YccA family protein [Synergistaceae bacterium]|jgi:FtsH-binding integral membrane protein|nr:Bax inhibitor-1/YccA family protein [Synergistaceae bacterium]